MPLRRAGTHLQREQGGPRLCSAPLRKSFALRCVRGTLNHHWRIRQFIPAGAVLWKMLRQMPRYGFDALEDAGLEISLAELDLHHGADFLPFRRSDQRVDAAVRENFDVAIRQQEIDQHTV